MANRYQALNRDEIRRSILINLGIGIIGTTTSEVPDTSSLIDTLSLSSPSVDEYNGDEVLIYSTTDAAAPQGESTKVSDYNGAGDATLSPVLTAAINTGDKFELVKAPSRITNINDVINQVISDITGKVYPTKETHTTFTESSKYLYNALSGYTHLEKVEYVYAIGTEKTIHDCDTVWDELVDADVTATADTSFYKEGGASLKLVVAANCAAGDTLATEAITSLDISGCTEAEIWIYSTVALDAGDIQLLLDNTALCASAVESLDIPATTANTWTRHVITLANPQSDSAVISVGLKMVTDKGAFTLWADDIIATDDLTKDYRILPGEYWGNVKGSTPYLSITSSGLSVVGANKQLRLTGNQQVTIFSNDTTDADLDPMYIIAKTTERLGQRLDIPDKVAFLAYWRGEAERKLRGMTPNFTGDTRIVS